MNVATLEPGITVVSNSGIITLPEHMYYPYSNLFNRVTQGSVELIHAYGYVHTVSPHGIKITPRHFGVLVGHTDIDNMESEIAKVMRGVDQTLDCFSDIEYSDGMLPGMTQTDKVYIVQWRPLELAPVPNPTEGKTHVLRLIANTFASKITYE